MGIFSFMNRNQENEDNEGLDYTMPSSEEERKEELPELHREMPVEILGENNQMIISGIITEWKGREITLGRRPGGLSMKLCEIGSNVVLQGSNSKLEQFYFRGTVAESSRTHIKLTDLVQEIHENQRDAFRLVVNAPVSVYSYDDERMTRPEKCTLIDISVGGCCISSEYLHGEGEVLRIKIKLEDYVDLNLVGEVIRVMERGRDDFRCGILFAQLTREEHQALTKMLFNLQVGSRLEHRRGDDGHW